MYNGRHGDHAMTLGKGDKARGGGKAHSRRVPPPNPGGLTPEQEDLIGRLGAEKNLYTPLFSRVYSGKASPRQAIRAKCMDCSNWQRAEVRFCTVSDCALWPYRPFREGA